MLRISGPRRSFGDEPAIDVSASSSADANASAAAEAKGSQLISDAAAGSSKLISDSNDAEQAALQQKFQMMFKTAAFAVCTAYGGDTGTCTVISDVVGALGKGLGSLLPAARGTEAWIDPLFTAVGVASDTWEKAKEIIGARWEFMARERGLGAIPFAVNRWYLGPEVSVAGDTLASFYRDLIRSDGVSDRLGNELNRIAALPAHPTLDQDGPYGGFADTPERALLAYLYADPEGWGTDTSSWWMHSDSHLNGDANVSWNRQMPGSPSGYGDSPGTPVDPAIMGLGPFGIIAGGWPRGCDQTCVDYMTQAMQFLFPPRIAALGRALQGVSKAIDMQISDLVAAKNPRLSAAARQMLTSGKVANLSAVAPSSTRAKAMVKVARPVSTFSAPKVPSTVGISGFLHNPRLIWSAGAAAIVMVGLALLDREG